MKGDAGREMIHQVVVKYRDGLKANVFAIGCIFQHPFHDLPLVAAHIDTVGIGLTYLLNHLPGLAVVSLILGDPKG